MNTERQIMSVSLHRVSRRKMLLGMAGAVAAATPQGLRAFDGLVAGMMRDASNIPVTLTTLTRGLWLLENSGGNIVVLDGPDGQVLIDAGIRGAETHIRGALRQVSARPVVRVINTHWHFDHTGGNVWLGPGVRH